MIWILILGELGVFAVLLTGFAVAGLMDPATFSAGHARLHPVLAGSNTLVLLTSGFLTARAVERAHRGLSVRGLIALAMGLGVVFLVIKGVEYSALFGVGIGIETDGFFRLYFLITGFHALHIVFGIMLLGIVTFSRDVENLETGAAFWHLLDVLWMLIFPVVYLQP